MTSRPTVFGAVLTVLGAGVALWGLLSTDRPDWARVLCLVALGCWLVRTALVIVPARAAGVDRVARVAAVVAVAAGSVAGPATGGNALVPAAVCVMVLLADAAVPVAAGGVALAVSLALVAVGALGAGSSLIALIAMLAAVLIGGLAGASRRQAARAQRREALLADRDRQLREEAARIALARDLHDVLAHSLGGLVVQLDAAEALLESGDSAGALDRVAGARELAASGLGEARRAVAALRRPGAGAAEDAASEAVPGERVVRMLDDLVSVHRRMGGAIRWERTGEPVALSAAQATGLVRALQEALSNVRRHAPGAPVEAAVRWQPDLVRLRVANPVPTPSTEPVASAGFGLRGMAERVQALPLGGRVRVDRGEGRFELVVEEVLA